MRKGLGMPKHDNTPSGQHLLLDYLAPLFDETEWPNNTLLTYTLPADGQGEGERGRWGHKMTD